MKRVVEVTNVGEETFQVNLEEMFPTGSAVGWVTVAPGDRVHLEMVVLDAYGWTVHVSAYCVTRPGLRAGVGGEIEEVVPEGSTPEDSGPTTQTEPEEIPPPTGNVVM